MTGTIKTPRLNQQLFWNTSWLKQAWAELIGSRDRIPSNQAELNTNATFSAPDLFDDYSVEGEEPADLALLDLIPTDLALLNLPCATPPEQASNALSLVSSKAELSEEEELASLIPPELSEYSLQLEQAA